MRFLSTAFSALIVLSGKAANWSNNHRMNGMSTMISLVVEGTETGEESEDTVVATVKRDRVLEAADADTDAKSDGDFEYLTRFRHFMYNNHTQTCVGDVHTRPFNNQIRGVNLGGMFVLEPWITPSLFYQFLGGNESTTAFDIFTFCKVLGPAEANRQLRLHWDTWVTEDIIYQLAASGAVNSLRLPVGDFMYKPYGPYGECTLIICLCVYHCNTKLISSPLLMSISIPRPLLDSVPWVDFFFFVIVGCVDGSLDYVERILDWAYASGLTVLIDIHALKDSQNGFDNSGQAMGFRWTTALNSEFADITTFEVSFFCLADFSPSPVVLDLLKQFASPKHWPIRSAGWMGHFDQESASYPVINYDNIQHALDVIQIIVDTYSGHPAVLGLEPVNEPWQFTPIVELKNYYWEGYLIVKKSAPYWKYVVRSSYSHRYTFASCFLSRLSLSCVSDMLGCSRFKSHCYLLLL